MLALPCSTHPHVKCALAAVADMSFLKADDQVAEFREAKPLRHMAAKNPALGFSACRSSFPGDHKHERHAIGMSMVQEVQQFAMSSRLCHAVKIEPRIDVLSTPR